MSNKLKVNAVPCDFCLWLARAVESAGKNCDINNSKKLMRKAHTTFGFSFNKTALRMKDLGFMPKVKSYECEILESMGMGDRNPKTLHPTYKGKRKHVHPHAQKAVL